MAKQNAVWGIDIGQCALKALRCTWDADGQAVVADKYDFIEYPKILSQPDSDPEELIKDALEEFLSRNEVLGDRVAISVSGQAGLSRFFKPPPVEIKTLPDIVKYEVKQQIPFPIEDVIWDWQQLGGVVVEGRAIDAEVGLFAMKREAVYRALRPFDDIGVEIDIVQLSPLSIFNVVCFDQIKNLPDPELFDPDNPPPSVVVLSMGTDTTDLIVTNGIKLWLRNIPIGGNHFTKQLSREMKLTQAKAEHLKKNARVSENPKAIFKAMRPVFNDLVNEVQRSLTYFQSIEKSADLSEIILLGNAAKLPGLRQFLNKQLEIDIAKISEFNKLSGGEVTTQPTFSNNLLSFAPCYGLCIQGLKESRIDTNLLPQEIVVERIIRAKKPWVLASVGLLTFGLLLGYFSIANAWWSSNEKFVDANNVSWKKAISQVKSTKSKSDGFIASDEEQILQLQQFNTIATELTSASEGKASWIEFYSALSQAFPEDPRIKAIKDAQPDHRAAPTEIPFSDREELYVDHVESAYFPNLQAWLNEVKPIHDKMFQLDQDEIDRMKQGGASAEDVEDLLAVADEMQEVDDYSSGEIDAADVGLVGPLGGKKGWVIEIRGHHFHNSDEQLAKLNMGKAYLVKTLIKTLIEKDDVVLPTNGKDELFSYADIGITFPTVTFQTPLAEKTIVFDPTATEGADEDSAAGTGDGRGKFSGGSGNGMGMGMGMGMGAGEGAGDTGAASETLSPDEDPNVQKVNEFTFVVQMAWTPRSEKERMDARTARLEKIAADKKAEAGDAIEEEG
ncbi:type IV pilus assembly protein PilM [bacterium]|nr:type IV pilus assembly protein PilM [Mariniblastus sp.]MDB4333783.1 type IV pilus assembly protein PilM [bacterium]MDB4652608.1 type IV pilus assembly protein PilM [bacterium]